MNDKNESTVTSLVDIWLNGFRRISTDEVKSTDYGVRY